MRIIAVIMILLQGYISPATFALQTQESTATQEEQTPEQFAKAHLRNFLTGKFDKLSDAYAEQVILMPGHELLKPSDGLAGPQGRVQQRNLPQEKYLDGLETAFSDLARDADRVNGLLDRFRFTPLEVQTGDFATAPADPVATADGKLHFTIAEDDVLLKVGPAQGDFMLFQLRKADGNWKIIAEYLD